MTNGLSGGDFGGTFFALVGSSVGGALSGAVMGAVSAAYLSEDGDEALGSAAWGGGLGLAVGYLTGRGLIASIEQFCDRPYGEPYPPLCLRRIPAHPMNIVMSGGVAAGAVAGLIVGRYR
jgi:hypothetical protein